MDICSSWGWHTNLALVDANWQLKRACMFFCDHAALATLRFRHLGKHFIKPCDFENKRVAQKIANGHCAEVTTMPTLMYSILHHLPTRHKILSQAIKFIHMMLMLSLSCWTLIIRSLYLTILLQFGGKAPPLLRKLKKLSLSMRRGPRRFWILLGDWTKWS